MYSISVSKLKFSLNYSQDILKNLKKDIVFSVFSLFIIVIITYFNHCHYHRHHHMPTATYYLLLIILEKTL